MPPVALHLKAMAGKPPSASTASTFSRLEYALSPDTSLTLKVCAVALTSGPNCGASAAECRVDLEGSGERDVRQECARPSPARLRLLDDVLAQVVQQHLKAVFLGRLRLVVGGPVLLVGLPLGDGVGVDGRRRTAAV